MPVHFSLCGDRSAARAGGVAAGRSGMMVARNGVRWSNPVDDRRPISRALAAIYGRNQLLGKIREEASSRPSEHGCLDIERARTLSPPRKPRLARPPRPRCRCRVCLRRRGSGGAGWFRPCPGRAPLARGPAGARGRPLGAAPGRGRFGPARPQPRGDQPAGRQRHPQRMRPGEPVPIEPGDPQHRARVQDQGGEKDHECQKGNDASHARPGWPGRPAERKDRRVVRRPTRPRPARSACCARPPAPSPGCRAGADRRFPAARCPASIRRARPSARS